ncbi:MAG: ABC transporter ATP-binding protein/permease [Ignavibacteria bacterium]|nr:ABC transporter ATP-binding protein/permease [Ignavibacteria bacterium]
MAIRKIFPYISKHKVRLIVGFVFVIASNLFALIIPKFVGKAVDLIARGNFLMKEILEIIFWILLLTIVSGFFMYLTRRMIIVLSRIVEFELREDFLDKVSILPYSFFAENSTGRLIALATNDVASAREFLGPALMYTASTVTTFVMALFFMLNLDLELTLLSILPLPLITLTTYVLGRKIYISFKDVQEHFSKLTTQAQETFSAIRLVKAFVREIYEAKRFNALSEEYRRKNMKLEFFQTLMIPLLIFLIGLSQLIVIGYGGLRVMRNTLTLGEVSQFFVYINMLIWPVAAIGWVTNLIQRASASIDRLWKVFEIETQKSASLLSIDLKGKIVFAKVSFKYSTETQFVLDGISFVVEEKKSLGILGEIGAGKSTIVKLLSKIYRATEGTIFLDHFPIEEIDDNSLRKQIGVVTQEPFLFASTIAENVRIGKLDANEEEILYVLELAGLGTDIQSFPNGINTIIGERGINLSGGQKQRLTIARALISRPKILILDDAFSLVDSETEQKILKNIFEIDCTKVIISTRISSVLLCDKIILLENGKIVEEGSHRDLLELNGKYARIFEIQKLAEEIERN